MGLVCRDRTKSDERLWSRSECDVAWIAKAIDEAESELARNPTPAILIEYELDPDGLWEFLNRLSQSKRRPALAVFGRPGPVEAFRLAKAGVDRYFESFKVAELVGWPSSESSIDPLRDAARRKVGLMGVKEAQKKVRAEMFREALELTGGNRHAAARLLQVDRRYVTRMAGEIGAFPEDHG